MIVLGLDLSMSKTGVAVFENGKLKSTGILKPKLKWTHGQKLKYYFDEFNRIKDVISPDFVAIEMGISRFNKSTQVIFRVHGVANLVFQEYTEINTSNVKKIITGKGNADKQMMIDGVKRIFDVDVSEDEADAIGVALCFIENEFK